ncbi:hypothetical protein KFL_002170190 [Klebsormidium nitens]|uniref:Uncharacterized protein n=1 Tax=Klebsormidium nitens TaxID=105231 RepID=A0A1Y1I273_KLENI|nr:hypothetical protein KFL_002170190 [Klebsormidium nitens]|eukprot:GAQ85025.1 hypothetical protein KFL_002170190 [Klebsormidium nitens]
MAAVEEEGPEEVDLGEEYEETITVSSWEIKVARAGLDLKDVVAATFEMPDEPIRYLQQRTAAAAKFLEEAGHTVPWLKLASLKNQPARICSIEAVHHYLAHVHQPKQTGVSACLCMVKGRADERRGTFLSRYWAWVEAEHTRIVATPTDSKRPRPTHPSTDKPPAKKLRMDDKTTTLEPANVKLQNEP